MKRALAAVACAAALAGEAQQPPVEVTVTPLEQAVKQGEKPVFHVVVRALEPTRVLDVARRDDIRDKVARPRMSGAESMDDIPVDLKPLGAITDADYVDIKPGQAYVFDTHGEPLRLETLPPGTYGATIRYRRDMAAPLVNANRVTFTVSR
ncbi:MAG TPA: hypothetical protein VLT89_13930 [Usitatibacter sp.]|nr:hypothetical protein [Usitatibacter sp.]